MEYNPILHLEKMDKGHQIQTRVFEAEIAKTILVKLTGHLRYHVYLRFLKAESHS